MVANLALLEEHINRHDHGACLENAKVDHGEVRKIRTRDDDSISLFNARGF